MALTKVFVTVKTYPTLSAKYTELVCTAGFREDGSMIRIYPVPFRMMKDTDKYSKWQWIEVDLVKNSNDFRKESFRPHDWKYAFVLGETIGTEYGWARRKEIVLRNVYTERSDN